MEQTVGNRVAVLVYHYFLERRMVDVAEMFAEKCVYLKEMKRSSYHCLLSSTPMQSLCWLLVEHETLLCNMKRLIRMYHGLAPLPFEATTWEKIQCLMECLYERAACNGNTVADSTTKTPGQSQTMSTVGERDDENVYQLENNIPHQQTPSMQQEHQNVSAYKDMHQSACQQADPTSSVAEQTTVLYVANDGSEQQLDKDTIVIRLDDGEIATNVQTDSVEHLITIDDDDVSIGQLVEVTTLMVEPVHLSAQSAFDENAAEEFANKENHNPLPVPIAIEPESVQPNTANDYVLNNSETTSTTSTVTAPENTSAVEIPSITTQAPPSVKKKPIDPEALEEWKRIRSLNNRNFDDHIRQINRQQELMNDLRTEAKKSTKAKSKATPPKQNSRKTVPKANHNTPKGTKQSAQKRKVGNVPGKEENGMPPAKRPATKRAVALDSESSDFASSTDEDEDVRVMSQRIKQYRAQQKRSRAKEKKSEETTEQQSNVFTSPSTLKQCRVNLIVGQRSTRKSPVKRGLRNRTPSTTPVGTPVKLSNPVTDSTAIPAARRIGTARQQLLLSEKKAKESTDHQKPVPMSVTAKQPPRAPVTLSPSNRRPVRACTVNRKTFVASTPLKQTVPNVEENVAPALTTPEQKKESSLKSETEPKPANGPVPEANNPVTVDAGEAAIYAVLAQLHGDN